MDRGVPLTRSSGSSPASPPTSPPAKKNFLSRLRRAPSHSPVPTSGQAQASTHPYTRPGNVASASSSASTSNGRSSSTGVRKNQVGVPIMMGVNRSEVLGPSTSVRNGFGLEDEIEWERVRTLPRVRLVPPEDEGEPIILYPPPHYYRPATPPPSLPHPLLSPPTSPPTSPTRIRRPGSPPQSPPRRGGSVYAHSPTWAGMADGFILPPPKFTRTGAGWGGAPVSAGVILPKKREEVNEDRRRRRSGASGNGWNEMGSPPSSPPRQRMRSLESQEEIQVNRRRTVLAEAAVLGDDPVDLANILASEGVSDVLPAPPILITSPPHNDPPLSKTCDEAAPPDDQGNAADKAIPVLPASAPSLPTAPPIPVRASTLPAATPSPPKVPATAQSITAAVPQAARRTRAMSLSAAFSSSGSLKNMNIPPLPPLPPKPPMIRKQKSLKMFFFSSTGVGEASNQDTAPPVPTFVAPKHAEPKPKKTLQKAKSKPSLKIDVKAAKPAEPFTGASPITPALSTGQTAASSDTIGTPSITPVSATGSSNSNVVPPQPPSRGLSKRFSLSNMSQAFKRKSSMSNLSASAVSSHNSGTVETPIPMVPDLPAEYKRQKATKAKSTMKVTEVCDREAKASIATAAGTTVPAVYDGIARRSESLNRLQSLSTDDPKELPKQHGQRRPIAIQDPSRPLLPAVDLVPARSSSPSSISTNPSDDEGEGDSELSEEQELVHAKLMQISPRTRRDPTASLQEFLASAPGQTGSVVIVPKGVRRSVEAVVIGSAEGGLNSATLAGASHASMMPVLENVGGSSGPLNRVIERRGSETEEEEEIATPMEEVAELFPHAEQRGVDGHAVVAQELGKQVPLHSAELLGQTGLTDWVEVDLTHGAEDIQPCKLIPVAPHHTGAEDAAVDDTGDLDSLPSDIVLVDTPPAPPPSQASPCNSTPQPKNRFASPEALFKRLSTSRKAGVHVTSHQYQVTPHPRRAARDRPRARTENKSRPNEYEKDKERYRHIPMPPVPSVPGAGPCPLRESTGANVGTGGYSSLAADVQLRSLHFDTLGLDFGGWGEASMSRVS
ncbi:hypothetical protein IAU60_001630 [Kwoniella sp. DSM 27419]